MTLSAKEQQEESRGKQGLTQSQAWTGAVGEELDSAALGLSISSTAQAFTPSGGRKLAGQKQRTFERLVLFPPSVLWAPALNTQ